MTSRAIPFGTRAAFGDGVAMTKSRRRPAAAATRRMMALFQAGMAVVLLALGLLSMTAIGAPSAADATAHHGPVPGFAL